MENNCFFRVDGSNGATFFLSSASFADWKKSLGFYRGVSYLAAVKKFLLLAAYFVMKRKATLPASQVVAALRQILPESVVLMLDDHDSAMISPTRDKVIIHHHGRSFEKFAVGASCDGVARELDLYQLLESKKPQYFCFSPLLGGEKGKDFVRLEMAYPPLQKGQGGALPLEAFAEFFDLKRENDATWASCWERLRLPFEVPATDREGTTPVGVVHYDFKPWNVNFGKLPQVFDFESVSFGLPLTDFFNYVVDPALHFGSVKECLRILREQKIWQSAQELLVMQKIAPEEVDRYWRWYLLERYDHFTRAGDPELADKFLALYRKEPPVEISAKRAAAEVAGMVIFAFLIRLWYAWNHPLESNDGITYMQMLRQWAETGSEEMWISRPPLFFYLTKCLVSCGLSVENAALAVNLTAGSLLVIPVYFAARALWRKHFSGIAAALFCAVMPKLVKFSCVRLRDGLYLFFAGWTIALWAWSFRSAKCRNNAIFAFFCGFAIASGAMCRFEIMEFLPWVVLTLPLLALYSRKNWRCALLLPAMVLFGFGIGLAGLSLLPGMPCVWQSYVDRLRMHFWMWKIWGLR